DPDDSSVKVPVPEGAYAISYSTLNGEVYGAFSDDIKVAAANYTPSNGDDDTDDEQETSSHGGSSGCNAGFGLLALAALALAYRKFSK
ncbi:MAG: SYNERG-CTERM sorting domain-containing protein, partial [Synergistaceae bacterium]|nr:SYNERG-CTERM sorting domain-containing protein [Synergistaceae bacterium]